MQKCAYQVNKSVRETPKQGEMVAGFDFSPTKSSSEPQTWVMYKWTEGSEAFPSKRLSRVLCQKSQSSTSKWLSPDSKLATPEGESCGCEFPEQVMGDTGSSSSGSASDGRRLICKRRGGSW